MLAGVLGPVLLWTSRQEQKRLAEGKTYGFNVKGGRCEQKTLTEHQQLADATR